MLDFSKNMNLYQPTISKEELSLIEVRGFEGEITVIDTKAKEREAIAYLNECSILGFDTETKPSFKRGTRNSVALLQLSDGQRAFLFQLKKIGLSNELKMILSSQKIIKVGAAVTDDIRGLARLNGFIPAGFIELQTYVKKFGIEEMSLMKLSAIILKFKISKSQRLSNWELPTLTESQQRYAATDAWVGCKIYEALQAEWNK
ncbi:MAG: 3'-5' exonuclease [Mangrovibacterium sp.]